MASVDAILFSGSLTLLIISWILLLIVSARKDFAWALCTVLLPPVSYLVALFRWSDGGKEPVLIAVAGSVLLLLAL